MPFHLLERDRTEQDPEEAWCCPIQGLALQLQTVSQLWWSLFQYPVKDKMHAPPMVLWFPTQFNVIHGKTSSITGLSAITDLTKNNKIAYSNTKTALLTINKMLVITNAIPSFLIPSRLQGMFKISQSGIVRELF